MSDFLLRDVFNEAIVDYIAKQISSVFPKFDSKEFFELIMKDLDTLSFGDRSNLITDVLDQLLPDDKEKSIQILIDSLGPEIQVDEMSGYEGFYVMPMADYVSRNGLKYFDLSMKALYEMTKRFTSESPIRTFLREDAAHVFSYLDRWVLDDNAHIRRLVSEGTSPRLPLSSPLREFIREPQKLEKYLIQLKNDPVLYVRRSVANNINDMSKDNPDYVCTLLRKFNQDNKDEKWIVKHALRTLLKRTHIGALQLIGYTIPYHVKGARIRLEEDNIKIGDKLHFEVSFESTQEQRLLIHYIIHYMKANGKQKPKVFILRDGSIPSGSHKIKTSQSFRQMSTRKHYPGDHSIELQINGKVLSKEYFTLVD